MGAMRLKGLLERDHSHVATLNDLMLIIIYIFIETFSTCFVPNYWDFYQTVVKKMITNVGFFLEIGTSKMQIICGVLVVRLKKVCWIANDNT